ncbi:MAG TPA: sulfatase-like hydrolase/transferase [Verrucomicrobiae bacterium]|nr:sulfatase-like hydrolase/transferase [Verrucomicrobiae bacterium]
MKLNCLNRLSHVLLAGLLAGTALPGFMPEANAQLSFVFTNRPSQALPRRPGIILIVADGLGYGDLSCYGQTQFQTPNLDQLAAGGIRFTNYSAGDAASSPARAALLLGRNADHLRRSAAGNVTLTGGDVTVEQLLRQSGYHTGLIGEWDLGDENSAGAPWKKGFDEFAGDLASDEATNYYADYMWRYAPRSILTTNNLQEDFVGKEMLYPNTGGQHGQYIPDLLTKATLNFVKNNQPDQFNRYRPFFLLLDYTIPGTGSGPVPTDAPYSEEPWPQPQKNKAAMISRLDSYVGQLQQQLQGLGLTNDVVIFFTSDTGPQKGGGVDLNFFHSITASNSLRVPMIVSWPGKVPAGQVSAYAWTASDFLPTAMDIALTKAPADIDGRSVLPTLLGQTQTNRQNF